MKRMRRDGFGRRGREAERSTRYRAGEVGEEGTRRQQSGVAAGWDVLGGRRRSKCVDVWPR